MPSADVCNIALSLLKGVTPEFLSHLSEAGLYPSHTMRMQPARLASIIGCNPDRIWTGTESEAAMRRAEEIETFCTKKHIEILHFGHEGYPVRLRECHDAPVILYKIGPASLDAERMIALVGTRRATPLAERFCREFVAELKEKAGEVTIVSGLAFGVDAMAHQAALDCAMPTVGVLAHGLDMIYPAQNKPLAEKIIRGGALITEYPPGVKPFRGNFLARNRIVAGLTSGTLVVESPVKSGALNTANVAFGYSREVMAVPGRPSDLSSEGCNMLIRRNKAALVLGAAQAMETLGWNPREDAEAEGAKERQLSLFDTLQGNDLTVYTAISREPQGMSVDMVVARTGLRLVEVADILYNMEFNGALVRLPNSRYIIP